MSYFSRFLISGFIHINVISYSIFLRKIFIKFWEKIIGPFQIVGIKEVFVLLSYPRLYVFFFRSQFEEKKIKI